jgi:FKBP-type peptidyl-prolyl cis-trans isomerase FkpA
MPNTSPWTFATLLCLGAFAAAGCNRMSGGGATSGGTDPKTEDDKTFYALGQQMGKNIEVFSLSRHELDMVVTGVSDAVNKRKARIDVDAYQPKVFEMARKRQEARAGGEKQRGKEAVEKAAKESGAQRLPAGLVLKTTRPGNGPSPTAEDIVKVHYEGRLTDGTVFDSSYKRKQPAEFPLRGVIRCWTEGVQKMKVGEKAQLTCPSEIAYGDQGRPPTIPGGATLIFDVELMEILPKSPPASPPSSSSKAK